MSAAARCRLAVLASHPIQYFTPLYRRLAAQPGIDLRVLYCRDFGTRARYDKQFAQPVVWDTDQLSGYDHRFLTNVSPITDTFNPLHAINPGAATELLRGYDALWVNGYLYPSNWFAAAAAALRGTRLLFRSELRLRSDRAPKRYDALRDLVIRQWIRRSDALLYIGEENRQAYLRYGAREERLFRCPYSVDVERIQASTPKGDALRKELRRRWRVPEDRVVVLFVGKLTARKHPETVLDLCQELGPEGVHGVIAGSGPLAEELRGEADRRELRNVTFLGFVNQQQLPDVYALGDVFLFPSENEPWGLVLNEAMAAGLAPVVSDDVGSAPDLITPDVTGYTFPSGDWRAMTGLVRGLARDADERRRVGRAAAERSSGYSYDASVSGILEALRSVGGYGARDAAAV